MMPYLRFTGTKDEVKGDWESVTPFADKAGAVGFATEALPGCTEITKDEYESELAAIKQHNAAIPAPAPKAAPEPPLSQVELKALRALLAKP